MKLYFKDESQDDSLIELTLKPDMTVRLQQYDIDTRDNLELRMKDEVENGEGWASDNAEDGEWKTLDDYKERWLGADITDYYNEIEYVASVYGTEYFIEYASGGAIAFNVDRNNVYLSAKELIKSVYGTDEVIIDRDKLMDNFGVMQHTALKMVPIIQKVQGDGKTARRLEETGLSVGDAVLIHHIMDMYFDGRIEEEIERKRNIEYKLVN
jgi:hypothetical protein